MQSSTRDVVLAQYMFVNFGTPPGVVAGMPEREKALAWAFAEAEMKARKKK